MIDVIERIKQSVKEHSYPIIVGRNNHDEGMTVQGLYQVIDEELVKEPQRICKHKREDEVCIKGVSSSGICSGHCSHFESQECNSDLIGRKKLIEDIQLIAKELNKDKQNAESDDSDLMLAVDNQLSAIWRIKGVINNQPQVQPIVRTTEEVVEMLNRISCPDCDKNNSHCHFSESECKNYWHDWLTKKEV